MFFARKILNKNCSAVRLRRKIEPALKGCNYKKVFWKMQQIYKRAPMPNCDFNYKFQSNFIDLPFWYGCSSLNLMIIFGTSFSKITSRGLLLKKKIMCMRAQLFGLLCFNSLIFALSDIISNKFLHFFYFYSNVA